MPREMKSSGIEWIGEIPAAWDISLAFQIFQQVKNKNEGLVEKNLLSLSYGKIKRKNIEGNGGLLPESFDGYNIIEKDDIVLRLTDLQNDHTSLRVGLVPERGIITSAYLTLRNQSENLPRYLYYYLHTFDICKGFYGMGAGVRQGLNWEGLKLLKITLPSVEEQKKITIFLDRTCSEIDAVIEKTKATIEEYKKLKQAVITDAVTKGIRGDRSMKDSGISWVSSIPADWNIKRLKTMFGFGKGLPITKENLIEAGASVISYGQIHSKTNTGIDIKPDLIRFVSEDYLSTNPNSLVHFGDFIFADTSEDLEGCGNNVYVGDERQLFAGYHTITLCSYEKIDNSYLAYLFKTDCWRSQIRAKASGVKLFSISKKILSETSVLIPEEIERQEIVEYLNKKCAEIDKLIADKTRLLEEMESYKKSVIYEYVTGKKQV